MADLDELRRVYILDSALAWGTVRYPPLVVGGRELVYLAGAPTPAKPLGILVNPECPVVSVGGRVFAAYEHVVREVVLQTGECSTLLEYMVESPEPETAVLSLSVSRDGRTLACAVCFNVGEDVRNRMLTVDLADGARTERSREKIGAVAISAGRGLVFSPYDDRGPTLEALDGTLVATLPPLPSPPVKCGPFVPRAALSEATESVLFGAGHGPLSVFEPSTGMWHVIDPVGREPTWAADGKSVFYVGADHAVEHWDVASRARRTLIRPDGSATGRALRPAASACGRYVLAGIGGSLERDAFVVDLEDGIVQPLGVHVSTAVWVTD
jgi:hypothetical protein